MANTYWIVNLETKEYMAVKDTEKIWYCDWKENYPHTKGYDWVDTAAYKIWDHDIINNIPYIYDLCVDGGMFTLLVDVDKNSPEQIDKAINDLRHNQDIVSLSVLRLKEVKSTKDRDFWTYFPDLPIGSIFVLEGTTYRKTGDTTYREFLTLHRSEHIYSVKDHAKKIFCKRLISREGATR